MDGNVEYGKDGKGFRSPVFSSVGGNSDPRSYPPTGRRGMLYSIHTVDSLIRISNIENNLTDTKPFLSVLSVLSVVQTNQNN